ncbi:phosphomannomutase/phosphoglucomutase [Plasticicumulans acidivorans]|uniref:phosphomannomutase n=1 Tax=Plasticicumulans acidivorans TaxID=886464 RepID=A0A317MZI0_9GAMM|nr:phosphomannomutase/phosphoglucomutase [Plasticicumulans acidivorans]PWV64516.1 phosphomannomutase [Plasticicumulans acidivorans]
MEHVFRAYDIRGRAGSELNAGFAYELGQAIGSEAQARGVGLIVVGRDGRRSSPSLATGLREGLMASGVDVYDAGMLTTPALYVAAQLSGQGAGVMVTGSHNPPADNGFKIVFDGAALYGEAIQSLRRRIEARDYAVGRGRERPLECLPEYLDRLVAGFALAKPLKVVVDAGSGVAALTAPAALRRLGCEVVEVCCEVDGSFPVHHPDPLVPANLALLQQRVVETGAALGLAFDGDADRLGVVTDDGEIIWPDRVMMALACAVLRCHPGAPIVFDVKCSARLAQQVRECGGCPELWRTGHSLIKARRRELDAPFAGEFSGHLCFADWFGIDDALYAGLRLVDLLARDGRSASALFADYRTGVATPELRVACAAPHALVERALAELHWPDARVVTIDGLRVEWSDGWGLLRASNTEPCLVLRAEAGDADTLAAIKARLAVALAQLDPSLKLPE